MHRDRISPSSGSLCAILSSTDLIVLVMLCRARSDADAARRLRPPSPTARDSSFVSVSISCSACSARSTFPSSLASSSSSRNSESRRRYASLGLIVKHFARVAQAADMDACLFEVIVAARHAARQPTGFVIVAIARNSADQIQHVEFDRGMAQQMRQVAEPLGVLQTRGFPAVADGPVLALFAEYPALG